MNSIFSKINSLIFLHIPKTAGTTITSFIIKSLNLSPREIFNVGQKGQTHIEGNINFVKLSLEEKLRYKLICGHVEYFLIRSINYPKMVFTILRDPIDRIISLYYYILNNEKHHLHNIVKHNNLSISDFMRAGLWIELNNGMVRRLTGALNIPYGRCNFKMLEIAKFNLKNKIDLFGFQNRFHEFVKMLATILNIEDITYDSLNINLHRRNIEDIEKHDIEMIKRFNPLDIELYNYALKLYNMQYDNKGGDSD